MKALQHTTTCILKGNTSTYLLCFVDKNACVFLYVIDIVASIIPARSYEFFEKFSFNVSEVI